MTLRFFDASNRGLIYRPYFQDRQSEILEEGLLFFNRLAREVQPQSFVGTGWRTSQTKILDNAIVGYCKVERTKKEVEEEKIEKNKERLKKRNLIDEKKAI